MDTSEACTCGWGKGQAEAEVVMLGAKIVLKLEK